MRRQLLIGTASAAMAFLAPATAHAASGNAADAGQEPPVAQDDPSLDAEAADSPEGIRDIVITAQRREESLQRAAIAATAVGGDDLVRAGVVDATQLTAVIPALQVSTIFGPASSFYLRGVGNFVTNAFTDPAIAFNVNGVIYQRPTSARGVFFDLDRIEVLKGPQGTLYGRNATGGAINVITNRPEHGVTNGFAEFAIGNYDYREFTGAVNIAAGDDGAFRFSTQILDRDGYYTDGTGDDNNTAFRAQFSTELGAGARLLIGADYSEQHGQGAGATVAALNPDDRVGLFDPRAQAVYASTFVFLAGDTLRPLVNDAYNDNRFWGFFVQADIDTSVGTLTILPAYRRSDLSYRNYASSFGITQDEETDQATVEIRLAGSSGPLSYILGAYYFGERNDTKVSYGQQYFGAYLQITPGTDSYAGFGRLTYDISDRLRVNGGIRYTRDDKSVTVDSVNPIVICPGSFIPPPAGPQFCFGGPILPHVLNAPPFLFAPDGSVIPVQPFGPGAILQTARTAFSDSVTFSKVTWRAGVEYDLAPSSLLYASYETGFKAGGFHVSIDDPSFDPETISAITLGSKNRFLNNRLQVNLELYRWTYKDQQISHFVTNSVGGTEFVTENIGQARFQGAEVEVVARATRTTTLNAIVQYLDAQYSSFVYQNPANVAPVTGCPVAGPTAGLFTVDCSGLRPQNAPKWTMTAGLEQRIPLGSVGELTFNVQTRYQSEIITGFELLPSQVQEGYFTTDLQLQYASSNGRFTVAGYARNIEDNSPVGFSVPHPRAPALIVNNLRAPRTYGVRFGVRF